QWETFNYAKDRLIDSVGMIEHATDVDTVCKYTQRAREQLDIMSETIRASLND
ncbi:MAG: hypothetical protein HDQ88_12190, partial [Clostridia bacterium]|nr:hypothetical protein [Clostridia bacterium]